MKLSVELELDIIVKPKDENKTGNADKLNSLNSGSFERNTGLPPVGLSDSSPTLRKVEETDNLKIRNRLLGTYHDSKDLSLPHQLSKDQAFGSMLQIQDIEPIGDILGIDQDDCRAVGKGDHRHGSQSEGELEGCRSEIDKLNEYGLPGIQNGLKEGYLFNSRSSKKITVNVCIEILIH